MRRASTTVHKCAACGKLVDAKRTKDGKLMTFDLDGGHHGFTCDGVATVGGRWNSVIVH